MSRKKRFTSKYPQGMTPSARNRNLGRRTAHSASCIESFESRSPKLTSTRENHFPHHSPLFSDL